MITFLKAAVFAFMVLPITSPASGKQIGELGRTELVERLTTILSHKNYIRRLTDSAGEPSFETGVSWGDESAPAGWRQTSVTTARFDGCIVTIHLEKPGSCEKGRGGWDIKDNVVDLRFIDGAATVRPPLEGYTSLGASVKYPFRREVSHRLLELSERARSILDEGFELFPSDVPARLKWLDERYLAELNDEVLEGSHQRVHFCSEKDVGAMEPSLNTLDVTFHVDPERAGEFAALMDEYRQRYCQVFGDTGIQRIDLKMQQSPQPPLSRNLGQSYPRGRS